MGGNRSGKTTMGVKEDVWVATNTHPFVKPPVPNRGRIGVTDFKVLEQVIWPKIAETLPWDMVADTIKGAKGLITGVYFKNGSFFDIMSYEQMPMKWESVDLDWVHFDEPPPLNIWRATRARLIDRDGRVWFTLTPLEEPWLYDEVWEQCGLNPRYWGMMLDTRKNPYLSRKAVNTFVDEIAEDEYEARVEGKFKHLVGRVFKQYTDEFPYVIPDDYIELKPYWPRLLVLDPHEKTPWALEWYAYDEENDTIFRYDEYRHDPTDGIEAFGNVIRNKEMTHNAIPADHMRVGDTYGQKAVYNQGGDSLYDLIDRITGYRFRSADKSDQDSRIWDMINRYRINPITNMPRFVNFQRCVTARKETMSYVWDRHRTKAGQYAEEKQTPVKKNDHAMSCDFYMSAEWPLRSGSADPIHIFNDPQQPENTIDIVQVPDVTDIDLIHRRKRSGRLAESLRSFGGV